MKSAGAVRLILHRRFPNAIKGKGMPKLPLKIGIHRDIRLISPDLSMKEIRSALHDYTSGPTYLRALTMHIKRYDLDGKVSGLVSEDEERHARETLARIESRIVTPIPSVPPHRCRGIVKVEPMNSVSHNAFTSTEIPTHAPGTLSPLGFADSVRYMFNNVSEVEAANLVSARDKANIEYGKTLGPEPAVNHAKNLTDMVALLDHIRNKRKIEAIKVVRDMTRMGLKEAKDWVEALHDTLPAQPPAKVPDYHKHNGFMVMTRENSYDSYEVMRVESYRDDAQDAAKQVVEGTGANRETVLVEVLGRTKPVFSML